MIQNLFESGVVGTIQYETHKKLRQDIQGRWENLGLVEGLNGILKENVAILFENQARHMMFESTTAANSGSFETVVFPLIRRTFGKLLANDIVSVQALNMPIGRLFYLEPQTSEREWTVQNNKPVDGDTGSHYGLMGYSRKHRNVDTTGVAGRDPENRYYLPDDVVEPNADVQVTQFMKKNLYDLFYDDFLYDNSKGRAVVRVGTSKLVVFEGGVFSEVQPAQIQSDSEDGSVRKVLVEVGGFASYRPGKLVGPDGNEMDTESFIASLKLITKNAIPAGDGYTEFQEGESVPFRFLTQKYGSGVVEYTSLCEPNGKLYLELELIKPVRQQGKTLDGYIGIDPAQAANLDFEVAWIQYDSLELETEIGEVSLRITSTTVAVEERKLRATWSPEMAQDVSAFHNIDAEAELTALLSEQIAAEIDREILRDIRKAAPWQDRWDYMGWMKGGTVSTNYTQKDWNQTLITAVNRISAQIQKATLRGGANFIVVSTEIGAIFNDLEYFHVTDASAESDSYNLGIEQIGKLQNRFRVIVDPKAPHWSLIMGHHGSSILDTGYIYAPYVPMVLTPVMYNPFNAAPVKYIMTRYAKKLVNNRYYGAIKVDSLPHFDVRELR